MNQQITQDFQTISLADIWNILLRRKIVVLLSLLCIVALGVVYIKTTAKTYYSQSTILLENQNQNIEIKTLLNNPAIGADYISSEKQILLSHELIRKALNKIGAFEKPELIWPARKSASKANVSEKIDKEEPITAAKENAMINYVINNLKISQVGLSRAMDIGFTSTNKSTVAPLINSMVDIYIKNQAQSERNVISSTEALMKERVEKLQNDVKRMDTAIVEYKRKSGFIDSNGIALIESEVAQLSKKLINVQGTLAIAQVKWDEISSSHDIETAPDVLKSPLIQRLIDRQSLNKDMVAQLSREYGADHPEMISANNRLEEITNKINDEVQKIATSLEREYKIAKTNFEKIAMHLEIVKNKYNDLKSQNIKLLELERDAENSKNLLETLSLRWKEIQVQADMQIQTSYVKILSKASEPDSPKNPKPKLIMIASIIMGLGIGAALALILDYLQTGIYNGKQLRNATSLTNIALVPKLGNTNEKQIKRSISELSKRGLSDYTESVRSLSAYLRRHIERKPSQKVFSFTSVARGDGKSALVASIAHQMSLEGNNVLVIDCDLRNPTLSSVFELKNKLGLSDVLSKAAKIEDVIYKEKNTHVNLVGVGTLQDINIIKTGAKLWKEILKKASSEYDIVLLNGPPALHISDMTLLTESSQNILCVRWKKTPLRQIIYAQSLLSQMNFSILGTVITSVNPKKIKQLNRASL